MNDYLPRTTLLRLLVVLTLVLLPHALQLPLWESLLIAALIVWRGLSATRQWRAPPKALRVTLTLATFVGVYLSYTRVSGQAAGTALLCVMAALKLLELRARRDVMVMVFLMYFLLVTHFLVSQELWTAGYLLFSTVCITALLIECQHLGALPPRQTLRTSVTIVAQALPLMLVIFVLFPRIPGPLWGIPANAGASAGRSGLSDQMAPGDITELIRSEDIAFRVEFDGAVPEPGARYWRGPVLDRFDGRTWRRSMPPQQTAAPAIEFSGTAIDYTLTLEPHRRSWLFALEMPARIGFPTGAVLGRDGELLASKPLNERLQYSLRSYPEYRFETTLGERELQRGLQLPAGYNPRTIAHAMAWRAQGLNPAQRVDAALRWFNQENFAYTLRPSVLGRDSIDDFLFNTRRGFCEHYASAFTVLMRAAGVPARVVAGYQGGVRNDIGAYYVVRQSDAHAWSEVWLEGRGWVRVDPTAAISPSRIESGLEAALDASEGLPGHLSARTRLRFYLETRWDWVNMQWNGWVLGYGPELQQAFLARFGITDLRGMLLALTVIGTALLSLVGLLLLRQFAPARVNDPILRAWHRLGDKLRKQGFTQRTDEGPRDFIARVGAARPEWAAAIDRVLLLYLQQRYLQAPDPGVVQALSDAIRQLELRR